MHRAGRRSLMVLGGLAIAAAVSACGGDEGSSNDEVLRQATQPPARAAPPNACPADGCKVRIVSVSRAGRELRIKLKANFTPDVSRNHFHIYWDTYTSKQVSSDAGSRFGVTLGAWLPTADNPLTTTGGVSVRLRKKSRKVCVIAADRYHNVIDAELFSCRNASGLL